MLVSYSFLTQKYFVFKNNWFLILILKRVKYFILISTNKKLKEFFWLSALFLFLRSISSIVVYKFLSFYDTRIFSFTDLKFYNESNINIFSPNFFFSIFVRSIGYNSENLLSANFIFISFVISFLTITPFIFLCIKILSKRNSIIFIIILSLHPYLALYSLKLDSNIFATLGVSSYALWILYSNKITFNFSIILNVFSTIFRNALIPFLWIQFLLIFFFKRDLTRFKFLLIGSLFLITIFITSSQIFYGLEYISQNYGCYSYHNIDKFFQEILSPNLSKILSLIFTPIVHMILNLGAREAIAIYCLNLPSEYAANNLINLLVTSSFLIFHSFLLIRFLIYIFKDFQIRKLTLLFPFSILLPTFYGTAHMRYLYPLLPFLIFIQFLPKNLKILKNI